MEIAPEISVVIPTYNRAETVCRCIDSVLASADAPFFEIIAVDDCSTDGTKDIITTRYESEQNVRCIRNEKNLNQAGARNVGGRSAIGNRILFLDDDNIVDPMMLAELSKAMDRDNDIGLVAPLAIQHHQGDTIWTLGSSYNFWTSQPVNVAERIKLSDLQGDLSSPRPTRYSPNAFMVSRAAWEETDGFDMAYGVMYEEADFGYRITSRHKGFIIPTARTTHMHSTGGGTVDPILRHLGIQTPRRAFQFARNRSIFIRRFAPWYCRPSALWLFTPLSAAYYCIAALRRHSPSIACGYLKGTLAGLFGLY